MVKHSVRPISAKNNYTSIQPTAFRKNTLLLYRTINFITLKIWYAEIEGVE